MRIGDNLKISGAVSMDDRGILLAPGNLEQQMKNCYADLEKILIFDDVTVETFLRPMWLDLSRFPAIAIRFTKTDFRSARGSK